MQIKAKEYIIIEWGLLSDPNTSETTIDVLSSGMSTQRRRSSSTES
jgi:hypothetical protein